MSQIITTVFLALCFWLILNLIYLKAIQHNHSNLQKVLRFCVIFIGLPLIYIFYLQLCFNPTFSAIASFLNFAENRELGKHLFHNLDYQALLLLLVYCAAGMQFYGLKFRPFYESIPQREQISEPELKELYAFKIMLLLFIICNQVLQFVHLPNLSVFPLLLFDLFLLGYFWLNRNRELNFTTIMLMYLSYNYMFLTQDIMPIRDSFEYMFSPFKYHAETIAKGELFPAWYPIYGGVRTEFSYFSNNSCLFSRFLGYTFFTFLPSMSIETIFKFQFTIGLLINGFGWWLVFNLITRNRLLSCLGVSIILCSGIGALSHQEQVVSTLEMMPYLFWAILKIPSDTKYLLPATLFFGQSLSQHYPFIHGIVLAVFLLGLILYDKNRVFAEVKKILQQKWILVGGIFCLLLSLFPVGLTYYSISNSELMSIYRLNSLTLKNWQEYYQINVTSVSSGQLDHLKNLFIPNHLQLLFPNFEIPQTLTATVPYDDVLALYCGIATLILALVSILLQFRKIKHLILYFLMSLLFFIGINGPMPLILFKLKFPFLLYFRQYYHFFPFVLITLTFLSISGIQVIKDVFKKHHKYIILAICFVIYFDLSIYYLYGKMSSNSLIAEDAEPLITDRDFFTNETKDYNHSPSFMMYQSNYQLFNCCKNLMQSEVVFTNQVIHAETKDNWAKLQELNQQQDRQFLSDIPNSLIQDFIPDRVLEVVPKELIQLHNGEIKINLESQIPGLLVLPMNYDLKLSVTINGVVESIWRVNQAFMGLLLKQGKNHILIHLNNNYLLPVYFALLNYFLMGLVLYIMLKKPKAFTGD